MADEPVSPIPPRPSIKAALWRDLVWLAGIILPPFGWGIYFYQIFKAASPDLVLPITCTLVSPILLLIAYKKVSYLVEHGVQITGKVLVLSKQRNKSVNITFRYEYQGKLHTLNATITDVRASELSVGSPVHLLVDPNNPSKFLII